jgi:sporulation protein YlmC with PRC-barrel domain
MLRSVKNLFEDKLGASDGEIGRVNDFYFDDQNWAVRYLVVDTGSWMPGRLVLISPHAFGNVYQGGNILLVNLTRQQLENSPPIESHKPVSRQYEELYYRYYGWPFYWRGDRLWGLSAFPIASVPPERSSGNQSTAKAGKQESDDPHLRSTKAIIGYQIQASDELVGHVTDFVVDDENWVIQHVVVDTRRWLSGKRVMISPSKIKCISWDESKLFLDLTKEVVLGSPIFDPAAFGIREHDPRIFA